MAKKVNVRCFVLLLGLPLSVAACSGDDSGSSSSFLESCSGVYTCAIDGESVESRLVKSGGRCYLGSLELRPDGTAAPIGGSLTTWAGDARYLHICAGTLCFSCFTTGAASGAPAASGTCTGSATSCSSVGASSCTDQGGCHYTVGSNTSSTSDDGCEGDPHPCSDYKNDAKGCEEQRGCTWR
ncbi:MAG: hypothetical protein ABW061_21085 [Polyangiaceae bacterium]